jgi:sec-independent protein translocase protein TatC
MRLEKIFKFREPGENPEAVKPFLDHLEDLRWMLVKIVVTLAIGMAVAALFRVQLFNVIERPFYQIAPEGSHLQVFSPTDPIIITFEVSFYAGIVITFPVLLFYISQFVLPALTIGERRIVLPTIAVAFGLFVIGVLFCYFFILPRTLGFFFGFSSSYRWANNWQVREYFAFATQIIIAFGLAFELPIVVTLLVFFRLLTAAFLRRTRAFAYIIVLCLAVVIAPTPDPITFLSLGIPMCLLYELCIWLGWFVERARAKNPKNS